MSQSPLRKQGLAAKSCVWRASGAYNRLANEVSFTTVYKACSPDTKFLTLSSAQGSRSVRRSARRSAICWYYASPCSLCYAFFQAFWAKIMPKAKQKTRYTLEEAVEFMFESSGDDKDSLFDSEVSFFRAKIRCSIGMYTGLFTTHLDVFYL